jgi:hypothetical protein
MSDQNILIVDLAPFDPTHVEIVEKELSSLQIKFRTDIDKGVMQVKGTLPQIETVLLKIKK